MDQLRFVNEQGKIILSDFGLADLIPFYRHPLTWIHLHQYLLAADLIREFFEHHFTLLKLGNTIELNPPEKQIKTKTYNRSDEPPDAGYPYITQAYYKGTQCGNPSLSFQDVA